MEAPSRANYAFRVREAPGSNGNVWEGLKMGGGKRSVIFVGDIGGTNTRLDIVEIVKGHFNYLTDGTFSSREEILK
jgi:hypothetical protein